MATIHRQLKSSETWRRKRKLHRDDGPALIRYTKFDNGELSTIQHEWYQDGKRHRINGPAVQQSYQSTLDFWRFHIDVDDSYYLQDEKVTKAYIQALGAVRRFRQRVKSFCPLPHWYRLYELTKTRAFCEWYYHPDNIGGIVHKRRIAAFLTALEDTMWIESE
jgi:hypothetical protein